MRWLQRVRITARVIPQRLFNRPNRPPERAMPATKKRNGPGRAGTGTGASNCAGGERSKGVGGERKFINVVMIVLDMKLEVRKPKVTLSRGSNPLMFSTRATTVSGSKQHCTM